MSKAKEAEVLEPGTEVGVPAHGALRASLDPEMARLMELALKEGKVEALERLVALSERVDARRAERELVSALAAFQSECPAIEKSKPATDTTREGGRVLYIYAPLEKIVEAIKPILQKHGLSFSWNMERKEGGVKVTCIVSHLGGGKREAYSDLPMTGGTSIMSAPQKTQATVTYGRRQSLIDALGLSTCDPDTDAADSDAECITEAQVVDLRALLEETKVPEAKFCEFVGVPSIEEIHATSYRMAVRTLEAKRKAS